MKIIFVSKGNDPRCIGGIEVFGRILGKIFKSNIKFLVYNSNKEYLFQVENEIKNIQIPNSLKEKIFLKVLGKTRYTRYLIKKEKPDIVIINKPKDLRMIRNGNFKKILIQHKDLESYKEKEFSSKNIVKLIRKELDYYIFLSNNSREKFLDFLKLNKEKGIVIRHSCEVELLEYPKVKNRKLIIIARIENSSKRIDLAIKAMKKLPEFILNIYGNGPDKSRLEKLVVEEGVKERVFFKGEITKIKEILDNSGIFIMTSDHEGYGITNIEAMMRGLPIILRNTFESAPDIVQNNGVLLEKEWNEDEFVEAVYKVYDKYNYYSKASIETGKRHIFEVIENKWIEFIKNIKN